MSGNFRTFAKKYMDSCDKIRLGIICECKERSDFGWLYSEDSVRLYFTFKKSADYILEDGTPVAFISLNDPLGYAVSIIPLDELPFLYAESSNGIEKERRKCKVLPYWEIHYPWRFDYCCINFPYKKSREHSLELFYKVLKGKEEALFMVLYSLHKSSFKYLSIEDLSKEIQRINDYVTSFSLENILASYRCGNSGYFQSRPGRDDHFHITEYKEIDTDDEYIRSLIPLGVKRDYYACVGRSKDDNDYDKIDDDLINSGKEIARKLYSKENHYAFLITNFFERYFDEKNNYENLLNELNDYKLSNRLRWDKFGYGNLEYENLCERIKQLNTKSLEVFKINQK
ncbi:MAG: hypothetical protein K2N05_11145 [Muribaculaceae bacterium]|nr:hypothetical protein [Muribaculaceae bacterium]